jgi:hypothetical protein
MILEVRWFDGYLETFDDIIDWRAGGHTLWIKHSNGRDEWIPLIGSVRRFSFSAEATKCKKAIHE